MRKISSSTTFRFRNIATLFIVTVFSLSVITDTVRAVDVSFYSSNDILFYNPDNQCLPNGGIYQPASGEVTVVQSNIKTGMRGGDYDTTKNATLEQNPDFVSLNEIGHRSDGELKTADYDLYRDNSARGQERGTAVLWRKDTWKKLDAGRVLMVRDGPNEYDPGRSATWVTLQNSTGGVTSMVSVHHMINPARVGPDIRKQLYKEGLEKLNVKISELIALGPVFVAGDFNSQYTADDPWGPRKILGEVGLKATFDSKGVVETHDDGGKIDYIFHTPGMEVTDQWTKPTPSDHHVLGARFSLGTHTATAPTSTVTPVADCTCPATSSDISLVGSGNEEKAFNFFVSNGLSPQQSAGVVGNMKAESAVLPMRQQSTPAEVETSSKEAVKDGSGWGIVQWTPPSKMISPSRDSGKSYEDIDTLEYQLQFLWEQLNGTGVGAQTSEKAAGDHLKTQTTIDASARSFMLKFERPEDKSESAQKGRVQLANEVFGNFGTGTSTPALPSTPSSSNCSSTASGGSVIEIAQAELEKGVKEDPIGCDNPNLSRSGSCGPEVDKYTDKHLEYWCADFVSWVYKEAGTPFTGGASGGWRIASVDGVQSWFKAKGTWVENGSGVKPEPGDVYTMGISHTGIVEKVEGNTIFTISGNTATDNTGRGNGVGRGSYEIGSSAIEGFGRMK